MITNIIVMNSNRVNKAFRRTSDYQIKRMAQFVSGLLHKLVQTILVQKIDETFYINILGTVNMNIKVAEY